MVLLYSEPRNLNIIDVFRLEIIKKGCDVTLRGLFPFESNTLPSLPRHTPPEEFKFSQNPSSAKDVEDDLPRWTSPSEASSVGCVGVDQWAAGRAGSCSSMLNRSILMMAAAGLSTLT